MLKSYEAIYDHGRLKWIKDKPPIEAGRIIVTVLEETVPSKPVRRSAPPSIAGKGKTLGDIVSPIVDEGDWECLK